MYCSQILGLFSDTFFEQQYSQEPAVKGHLVHLVRLFLIRSRARQGLTSQMGSSFGPAGPDKLGDGYASRALPKRK